MIRRDFHDPEISLIQGMGDEKARNENVQSNSVWCCRRTPGKLQHRRQLPAVSKRPFLSNTWNSLWTPAPSMEQKEKFSGYKCAGDLYSERGIRGEMKCLKCLGSGQQFTEALAAKKDCLSFPDSDTGERIAATAGTRMLLHLLQAPLAESHSPPLSKNRHS